MLHCAVFGEGDGSAGEQDLHCAAACLSQFLEGSQTVARAWSVHLSHSVHSERWAMGRYRVPRSTWGS